ncbi:MAG: hypothetical protein IJ689_07060 [Alphaproteobacteria bacterium]|nr:hypothetical protein [Alphaproteobacteria bacterium]
MIQKKKTFASEWHLISSEPIEKIAKYISAHGLSEEMIKKTKGRRFGRVVCGVGEDGSVKVLTRSRSFDKRVTLERKSARTAKQATTFFMMKVDEAPRDVFNDILDDILEGWSDSPKPWAEADYLDFSSAA